MQISSPWTSRNEALSAARRIRSGVGRTLRQLRGFPDPLVFMHVPKTGGTSLDQALARLYAGAREGNVPFGRNTRTWKLVQAHEAREDLRWSHVLNTSLCFRIAGGAPYLSGHFCVSQELIERTRPPYRFVTLLREPTERWISNYVYSRIRFAQDGKRTPPQDIARELREYLDSPRARREAAKYVFALGGHQSEDALFDDAIIERAQRTLADFDAVGFLDRLPAFESRLEQLVQRKIRIPHLRKTDAFKEPGGRTAADYKALFTPEVREEVRALCEPDYAIYHFGRELPIAS